MVKNSLFIHISPKGSMHGKLIFVIAHERDILVFIILISSFRPKFDYL